MFLVQHFNAASGGSAQYLKLMAINLSDCFSWKVVQTHEIPASFDRYFFFNIWKIIYKK